MAWYDICDCGGRCNETPSFNQTANTRNYWITRVLLSSDTWQPRYSRIKQNELTGARLNSSAIRWYVGKIENSLNSVHHLNVKRAVPLP